MLITKKATTKALKTVGLEGLSI